jgi:hypothetical protein
MNARVPPVLPVAKARTEQDQKGAIRRRSNAPFAFVSTLREAHARAARTTKKQAKTPLL